MISVIVPVYKVEPYLRQCVDSILAQTYSNLEIILVDDGSPDNCGAICDEYAAKDSRVKVIHQVNSGVSAARNVGLDSATGDYITFVDADDYIDIDMFDSLLYVARSQNADVVECNYRRSAASQSGTGNIYVHNGIDATIKLFTEDGYPKGFTVSPWGKLIDRQLACNIRFLEGCTFAEDMLYVVELFCKSSRVAKLDRRLYTYRITPDSATTYAYRISKADEVDAAYHAMLVMLNTENATLCTIGVNRYADLLLFHWCKCCQTKPDGICKAKALRQKLLQSYATIKQNLDRNQKWKCRILMTSPLFFYCISRVLSGRKSND